MAGRLRNTPRDSEVFRKEYLETLKMQSAINATNLQANVLYKKTGTVPYEPMDTRLTIQKLADVERLKQDVRIGLNSIMDGQQATKLVQTLTAEELVFLSQHLPQIILEIKPRYKYGILSDVMVPYLRNLITKEQTTNALTIGVPPAIPVASPVLVHQNLNDLVAYIYFLKDGIPQILDAIANKIDEFNDYIRRGGGGGGGGGEVSEQDVVDSLKRIGRQFDRIERSLPNEVVIGHLENSSISEKSAGYAELNSIFQYAPVQNSVKRIYDFINTADTRRLLEEWMMVLDRYNFDDLTPFVMRLRDLNGFNAHFGKAFVDVGSERPTPPVVRPVDTTPLSQQQQEEGETPTETQQTTQPGETQPILTQQKPAAFQKFSEDDRIDIGQRAFDEKRMTARVLITNFTSSADNFDSIKAVNSAIRKQLDRVVYVLFPGGELGSKDFTPGGIDAARMTDKSDYLQTLKNINEFMIPIYRNYNAMEETVGIMGTGLVKRGRGRPRKLK